jgi:acetyltransferase-like isoleucine patch superfamily enzyme
MGFIRIDPSASVHESCVLTQSKIDGCDIVIEERVVLEPFVRILPCGGSGSIIIKNGAVLNAGVVVYGGGGVIVGPNTLIGAHTVLSATVHNYLMRDKLIKNQGHKCNLKPISIGADCWIGAHSFVGPEIIIPDGCIFPNHSSIVKSIVGQYTVFDKSIAPVFVRR